MPSVCICAETKVHYVEIGGEIYVNRNDLLEGLENRVHKDFLSRIGSEDDDDNNG